MLLVQDPDVADVRAVLETSCHPRQQQCSFAVSLNLKKLVVNNISRVLESQKDTFAPAEPPGETNGGRDVSGRRKEEKKVAEKVELFGSISSSSTTPCA